MRIPEPGFSVMINEPEMHGVEKALANALTFAIYPICIDGFLNNFNGEVSITMNTGDVIHWKYEQDPCGNNPKDYNELRINNGPIIHLGDYDGMEPQFFILQHYQQYLRVKLEK
jgi:hypothetical protein